MNGERGRKSENERERERESMKRLKNSERTGAD